MKNEILQTDVQTRPLVVFTMEAWMTFWNLIDLAPGEISMLAEVTWEDAKRINVKQIFFDGLKQFCTPSYTRIDEQAMSKFLVQKEREQFKMETIRGSFHSHANFGVGWSSTDVTNIERFKDCSWFLSIVANHRHEILARLDLYVPFRITIDGLKCTYSLHSGSEKREELKTAYERTVRTTEQVSEVPLNQYPSNGGQPRTSPTSGSIREVEERVRREAPLEYRKSCLAGELTLLQMLRDRGDINEEEYDLKEESILLEMERIDRLEFANDPAEIQSYLSEADSLELLGGF